MKIKRLLGNFGTIRIGATAGIEFFWNRQWTLNYKAASATLTKIVKLKDEDLSALYVKGKCEKGNLVFKISQGSAIRSFNLTGTFNKTIDLTEFNAGLVKFVVAIKSARNMKVLIGWR